MSIKMETKKLGLFLIVVSLIAAGYYFLVKNPKSTGTPVQTAQLVTNSMFESYSYLKPVEVIRVIYQYDRASIPSEANYFYVNITIPNNVVQRLDRYAQDYPNDASLIPEVYAVKINNNENRFENFVQSYNVNILETDEYGVPKKMQVVFKTEDVPAENNYIIVAFLTPFNEQWNEILPQDILEVGQEIGNGWKVISKYGNAKIIVSYDKGRYSSIKALYTGTGCGGQLYTLLEKDINIPVDPTKPLYVWIDHAWDIEDWRSGTGYYIGFELVNATGSRYKVLFIRGWNPGADTLLPGVDCVIGAPDEEYFDVASLIRNNCNIDWNKVTRIDKVYVGCGAQACPCSWNSYSHAYEWIYAFAIANNRYIEEIIS